MISLLNPALVNRMDELRERFTHARPFGYLVMDSFVDPDFADELIKEFPVFDERLAVNEHGKAGLKAVHSGLRKLGPAYARFDGLMKDHAFLTWISHITAIPRLLYDPDYSGGGTHENLDGQELDPHVDFNYHPRLRHHRRLNLILFLNPEWDERWGGNLELMRHPLADGSDRITVSPLANRAVLFETTESSWHAFTRIRLPAGSHLSRRSLAVYFYTRERAAVETAASHATIYFQRGLPEHVKAGHTLTAQDVADIQALFTRRDDQMRFLYEREKKFSKLIEGITHSPSFRAGRALTWPARVLRAWAKRA